MTAIKLNINQKNKTLRYLGIFTGCFFLVPSAYGSDSYIQIKKAINQYYFPPCQLRHIKFPTLCVTFMHGGFVKGVLFDSKTNNLAVDNACVRAVWMSSPLPTSSMQTNAIRVSFYNSAARELSIGIMPIVNKKDKVLKMSISQIENLLQRQAWAELDEALEVTNDGTDSVILFKNLWKNLRYSFELRKSTAVVNLVKLLSKVNSSFPAAEIIDSTTCILEQKREYDSFISTLENNERTSKKLSERLLEAIRSLGGVTRTDT